MTKNVGTLDRMIRLGLGIVLLGLLFWMEGPIRWIGLMGFVFLATAAVTWCPIYSVLGIRTCPNERETA